MAGPLRPIRINVVSFGPSLAGIRSSPLILRLPREVARSPAQPDDRCGIPPRHHVAPLGRDIEGSQHVASWDFRPARSAPCSRSATATGSPNQERVCGGNITTVQHPCLELRAPLPSLCHSFSPARRVAVLSPCVRIKFQSTHQRSSRTGVRTPPPTAPPAARPPSRAWG
jgi:hypothetical protein